MLESLHSLQFFVFLKKNHHPQFFYYYYYYYYFGHQSCELLCLNWFLMMLKIVSKSHSPHVLETTPAKQKKKQRRP